jgi:hypothetical protein
MMISVRAASRTTERLGSMRVSQLPGRSIFTAAVVLVLTSFIAGGAAPEGWFLAGSNPANYETGVDSAAAYNNMPSAFLKARGETSGFGTLMQNFTAANYVGKRVRLSAFVKSENLTGWAGLWARVDGPGSPPKALAFDNMQGRPIKGTSAWQRYEVVLDVPEAAKGIAIGILLGGGGEMWINGASFEVVDSSVPVTSVETHPTDGPRNLSFVH